MKKIILFLPVLLLLSHLHSQELNDKEKDFLKSHDLSAEEKTRLDEIFGDFHDKIKNLFDGGADYRRDEVEKLFKLFNLSVFRRQVTVLSYHQGESIVFEHPRFPGWVIKVGFNEKAPRKNLSRVLFSDQINNFIDNPQINISKIKKIDHKVYHRPGRPEAPLNDFNYIVIAQKVEGIPYAHARDLTQRHVDEAIDVMNLLQPVDATFFEFDASPQNILFTFDKKIAFIDARIRMGKTRDRWFTRLFEVDSDLSVLTDKEKEFIEQHHVSGGVKKVLDYVFTHLCQETRDLFSGQGVFSAIDHEEKNLMEDKIKQVLAEDGFTLLSTHTLWSRSLAVEHDLLPGYVLKISFHSDSIKKGISRVIANDQINTIIKEKENEIMLLKPVQKNLYHRPGMPEALNDSNYVVVCEKVLGDAYDVSELTTQQVIDECNDAIIKLNNLLIAIDVIPSNILIDEQGCARFIDTEMTNGYFRGQWLERALGRL